MDIDMPILLIRKHRNWSEIIKMLDKNYYLARIDSINSMLQGNISEKQRRHLTLEMVNYAKLLVLELQK